MDFMHTTLAAPHERRAYMLYLSSWLCCIRVFTWSCVFKCICVSTCICVFSCICICTFITKWQTEWQSPSWPGYELLLLLRNKTSDMNINQMGAVWDWERYWPDYKIGIDVSQSDCNIWWLWRNLFIGGPQDFLIDSIFIC